MNNISIDKKTKLLEFISKNELDYKPIDDGIIRFHLSAYDGNKFYLYENNFIVAKYSIDKDKPE